MCHIRPLRCRGEGGGKVEGVHATTCCPGSSWCCAACECLMSREKADFAFGTWHIGPNGKSGRPFMGETIKITNNTRCAIGLVDEKRKKHVRGDRG